MIATDMIPNVRKRSLLILTLVLLTYFTVGQCLDSLSAATQEDQAFGNSFSVDSQVPQSSKPSNAMQLPLQNGPEKPAGTAVQSAVSPLITAAELKALIDADESVRLLEPATNNEAFLKGHIPTAQFLHWVTDMTAPENREQYNNLNSVQFGKLMNKLGVENGSRIVIYDRLSSRLSTRLFWTLKYFGHEEVQVLDGGHAAWTSKFKQTSDTVKFIPTNYKVGEPISKMLAEMAFVEKHLNDPSTKFVDGRPVKQFTGEVVGKIFHTDKPHPRNGHIPNAVNIFWKDNFDENGKFKTSNQLRALYQNAGIQTDQCVVTYCNEGLHAAPPWFVLTQLLGYEKVKLYDSSMAEWAKSKNPMDMTVEQQN